MPVIERPVFSGLSYPLVLIAFILGLLACLVGGGLITSSDLSVSWLFPGAVTSYFLALLVP